MRNSPVTQPLSVTNLYRDLSIGPSIVQIAQVKIEFSAEHGHENASASEFNTPLVFNGNGTKWDRWIGYGFIRSAENAIPDSCAAGSRIPRDPAKALIAHGIGSVTDHGCYDAIG